jgi:pyruvate,water dikinase
MQELFGAPQDVEWALCGDRLYLLQSRPITALPAEPVPIPIEVPDGGWDRDDHHGVLTPLGWSWIQPYPDELGKAFSSAGAPIEAIESKRIGGHLYQRMVMGGGESPKLPPRWVLWLASRLVPTFRRANRSAEIFFDEGLYLAPLNEWVDGGREEMRAETAALFVEDPRELDDEELLHRIQRSLAHTEKGLRKHAWLGGPWLFGVGNLLLFVQDRLGWDSGRVLQIVSGSSVATTALHRELEAIVIDHGAELEGLATVPRTWASMLKQCPELGQALTLWLEDNRLRMLHYEPGHPSLGERPGYVLSIVEGILVDLRSEKKRPAARDHAGEALQEARERLSEDELAELERLLDVARRGYALRDENGSETVSQPAGLLRHFVLELGRRIEPVIGSREHAVYLYAEEHAAALAGELDNIATLIEQRRGEESWALHNRGPLRYGPPKQPSPPPDVFPRGMRRLMRIMAWLDEALATPEPGEGDVLPGVGIGSQVVTGRARVIHRPEQIVELRHGEIVVCRITSPECAVALGRVAAIVTNEGGVLSHPAVIAREFDIPAVVGVAEATQRIATGDTIRVDPVAATVSLLR